MDPQNPEVDPAPGVVDRLERLERAVAGLERQIAELTRSSTAVVPPPPPPRPQDLANVSVSGINAPAPSPVPAAPMRLPSAETALKWTGVVLLFLAGVFLVSTAIRRGWIGPELQLAGAALGGLAMIGAGLRLRQQRWAWAEALTHGGVAVLGVCAGAAHAWLDLVSIEVSVVAVALVVGLAVALAYHHGRENLVTTGLLVGLFVPWSIGADQHFGALWSGVWLLALVAVSMAVAQFWHWVRPRVVGLVVFGPATLWLVSPGLDGSLADRLSVQVAIGVAAVAWWLAPWHRPASGRFAALDQRLVLVVPILAWFATTLLWSHTSNQAAVAALIAVVGFGALAVVVTGASSLRRLTTEGDGSDEANNGSTLVLSYVVGLAVLASAGLMTWIDGPTLLVALTMQAVGLAWLAARTRDPLVAVNAAVLWAVVGVWAGSGLIAGVVDGLSAAQVIAYLVVVVALVALTVIAARQAPPFSPFIGLTAWLGLLAWLAAVFGHLAQGQMIVSILWAGLGILLFTIGADRLSSDEHGLAANTMRRVGLATVAVTVVKLVTVDLAEVDAIWRTLLFVIVGLGLLRLGFTLGDKDAPTPVAENEQAL